jgi:hypothetical protein
VIQGADAVVFVANSAIDRLQENVTSLREMNEYLEMNQVDPAAIPLVFQHNKRDLPNVLSSEELRRALGPRRVPHLPSVATRGEGVLETLHAVVAQTIDHLLDRYRSLTLAQGQTVEGWTSEALHQVFGTSSIARAAPSIAPPQEDDRRLIQVNVPGLPATDEAVRGRDRRRPDDTRPPQPDGAALAEAYASASMDLTLALQRTQQERDEARRRLEQLEHTLEAIEAVELGRSSEGPLREVLHRITTGGGGRGATLIAAGPRRSFRLVTGIGVQKDPFLRLSDGVDVVLRTFARLRRATIFTSVNPDVRRALAPLRPEAQAVAVVPVRSPLGLHGLALVYYGSVDPLPSPTVLGHLEALGRLLAAWFSIHRALILRGVAGAAQQALPEIDRSARIALDLVRKAARDPRGDPETLSRAELRLMRVLTELNRFGDAGRATKSSSPSGSTATRRD